MTIGNCELAPSCESSLVTFITLNTAMCIECVCVHVCVYSFSLIILVEPIIHDNVWVNQVYWMLTIS